VNAPVEPRTFRRERTPITEPRPVHDARTLTRGNREAELLLDGMRYVLRITRQGKLILTK
jgi:hemin uptake protein HemP